MSERELPVTFSGVFDDVDDYIESLCGWGLEFSQLVPGETRSSNLTFNAGDYSFLSFSHSVVSRQQALAQGEGLNFFLPERSDRTLIVDNQSRSFDVLCCRPQGDDFDLLTPGAFQGYAFRFGEQMLLEEGYAWLLEVLATSHFNFPLSASDAESVRHSLRAVAQLVRRNDKSIVQQDLEIDAIYRHVLVPTVARVVTEAISDLVPGRGSAHLERLLYLISDNLDEPPTVEELGRSIGVTSRYVQQLFKRHVGMSPKQYIRSMRLNAVRNSLKRLTQRRGLITEIAGSHGFDHLGQFASDYKALFGELPNETLSESG
ncbi:MAG: AraC family transcriptional regulator [Pseudomonadota bacterium]|nr:AraC family transcriptional regulator [Pseudomonadota bacterium]